MHNLRLVSAIRYDQGVSDASTVSHKKN